MSTITMEVHTEEQGGVSGQQGQQFYSPGCGYPPGLNPYGPFPGSLGEVNPYVQEQYQQAVEATQRFAEAAAGTAPQSAGGEMVMPKLLGMNQPPMGGGQLKYVATLQKQWRDQNLAIRRQQHKQQQQLALPLNPEKRPRAKKTRSLKMLLRFLNSGPRAVVLLPSLPRRKCSGWTLARFGRR